MIRYAPYNVFIHGNPKYRRADFPFEPDDGPAAKAYEERIRVTLNAIGRTTLGRCVLRSLYEKIPVYIVPFTQDHCDARTGQLTSDWRQGVRIQYSPETWTYDQCGALPGYRPVETLFHEMVHASRFTNYGFEGLNNDPLDKMKDHEEFLAVMLTNMFRSEQGARKFNRDYMTGKVIGQPELESFLSSRRAYIEALEYFSPDDLVKLVVAMKAPFNPFRDLKQLKAKYESSISGRFTPAILR